MEVGEKKRNVGDEKRSCDPRMTPRAEIVATALKNNREVARTPAHTLFIHPFLKGRCFLSRAYDRKLESYQLPRTKRDSRSISQLGSRKRRQDPVILANSPPSNQLLLNHRCHCY